MQNFATDTDFKAAVDTALSKAGTTDDVRAALVAGIGAGETEQRGAGGRPADGALNLRIGDWVLRGQDMPVLEIIGMVGAAAAALAAPEAIAIGAVIAALTSFSTLCWKTWRKGATLSKAEIAVLGFLQVNGPMTQADLEAKATGPLDLKTSDIDNAILTLQQVELRDGDVVPLIRKDAAGQWRTQTA